MSTFLNSLQSVANGTTSDSLAVTTSSTLSLATSPTTNFTTVDLYSIQSSPSSSLSSSSSSSPNPPPSWTSTLATHASTVLDSTLRSTPTTTLADVMTTHNATDASTVFPFPTPTSAGNVSDEERRRYLDLLQADTTRKLIPTLVFLACLSLIGLCGNSLVLVVYWRKARRNATDIFIMAIAAFDLLTNMVAIPGEIYDTFHFWDFDKPSVCGFRVYFNAFTTLTSASILLAVAISRYKKVCRPFSKQTSIRTAKLVSLFIALGSGVLAIPQSFLNGVQTRPTPRKDIFGHECSTDDKYLNTIWPLIYMGLLMLLFLGMCIPLIVLYVLIGIQAWRHSQIHGIPIIAKTPTTSDGQSETVDSEDDIIKKPKTWIGFGLGKKKRKYDITPGDSSSASTLKTDDSVKADDAARVEMRNLDASKSAGEVDNYCKRMMRSPSKDNSHVNVPMLKELSFRLTKLKTSIDDEEELKKNEDKEEKDTDTEKATAGETVKNHQDNTEKPQENSEKTQENSEKPQENADENSNQDSMSDFAASMKWVDITYCINEDKTADQNDETDNSSSPRKKSSLSRKISREDSLRRKLADTIHRVRKAKKDSCSDVNDCEDDHRHASSIAAATIEEANDNASITFDETVTETDCATSREKGLKSGDISTCSTPGSGTLRSKSRSKSKSKSQSKKKKANPHRRVLTRTTLMLIIISAVYIIGFVPHLVVISWKFAVTGFLESLTAGGYAVYNIFLRFYFINSAANAIIYSICDFRFREQVRKLIRCRK